MVQQRRAVRLGRGSSKTRAHLGTNIPVTWWQHWLSHMVQLLVDDEANPARSPPTSSAFFPFFCALVPNPHRPHLSSPPYLPTYLRTYLRVFPRSLSACWFIFSIDMLLLYSSSTTCLSPLSFSSSFSRCDYQY